MSEQRDDPATAGGSSDPTPAGPTAAQTPEPAVTPEPEPTSEPMVTSGGTATPGGATGEPTRLRLRRAPRYGPFGATGVLLGVVAGIVLALSFSAASNYSIETIAGYFAAVLGLIGGLLGLTAAVLVERRHRR